MARKRERAFALSMALLFFLTAFGFSFYVIWQAVHSNSNSSSSSANQHTCSVTSVASSTTLPTPTVYKPALPVTSLQSTDLNVGTGATAKSGDCLVVKYYGTLAATGAEFDENFDKSTALTFPLGQGQVIKGWDQGVVGMKVGGTRRLVIPASLAYGSQSPSAAVPANSDLVFVIDLLSIQ